MPVWAEATWQGPPDSNFGGPAVECRGLVVHIAQGSYWGTIGWQQNPVSDVSSHFVVAQSGAVAQMLDTNVTAWTQASGNGHWVSVENEGFSGSPLTDAAVETHARLYAWLLATHGVPATLANSPSERGLGWHGMGGVAWGNHPDCPGQPIIDQRTAILARALQINGDGSSPTPSEVDMAAILIQDKTGIAILWTGADQLLYQNIVSSDMAAAWNKAGVPGPFSVSNLATYGKASGVAMEENYARLQQIANSGSGGSGPTAAAIAETVANELHDRLES